jgi:hypothetical protein
MTAGDAFTLAFLLAGGCVLFLCAIWYIEREAIASLSERKNGSDEKLNYERIDEAIREITGERRACRQ